MRYYMYLVQYLDLEDVVEATNRADAISQFKSHFDVHEDSESDDFSVHVLYRSMKNE